MSGGPGEPGDRSCRGARTVLREGENARAGSPFDFPPGAGCGRYPAEERCCAEVPGLVSARDALREFLAQFGREVQCEAFVRGGQASVRKPERNGLTVMASSASRLEGDDLPYGPNSPCRNHLRRPLHSR